MKLNAIYPVVGVNDVEAAKNFYMRLLDLEVSYDSDWYVSLRTATCPVQQVAFVRWDHESVPAQSRRQPQGTLVTIETEAVDDLHARAQTLGLELALELRDEPWGQRHFMVRGPDGVLLDIVKQTPPSREFAAAYT